MIKYPGIDRSVHEKYHRQATVPVRNRACITVSMGLASPAALHCGRIIEVVLRISSESEKVNDSSQRSFEQSGMREETS